MNLLTDTLAPAAQSPGLHGRAEQILLPGLGLGIAGDYLLREGPAGPGLLAWLALLAAAALWLTRDAGSARRRTLLLWSATALCAGLVTALRALETLIPAMLMVILACAVLTNLETGGLSLRAARVRDYVVHGFAFPLQLLAWAPRLLQQANLGTVARDLRLPGIIRGCVLAVPVLFVFVMLFASADAGFSRYLATLSRSVSPDLLQHLLLVLAFGWLGTSLLGSACRAPALPVASTPAPKLHFGATEAHVVLALVSALFAAFVLLQLGYLFGGSDVIVDTSGLTIAEYARRGFFELLVIGALTLGLLLVLDATNCERSVLRRYGTVLIACVLVILTSALQRFFLYTDAFGMTLTRFNALAIMAWQAFNLLSFGLTVLRGNVRGFASALVISGIASVLLLGLVNPASAVAKINLNRALENTRSLDTRYLLLLGADAVPAILDDFSALGATQQCAIARSLLAAYPATRDGTPPGKRFDWRRWNLGYARAAALVGARTDELLAAAQPVRGPIPLRANPFMPPAC